MSQVQASSTSVPKTDLKLSPEEHFIINMLREKKFQELTIKVQDGVIVSLNRTEKFTRKKGGLV